jgi:hypothetical protein
MEKNKTQSFIIKKKQLLFFDLLLFLIFIILFIFIRQDILVTIIFFFLILYLILTKRIKKIPYLIISFIISLIWILLAKDYYMYNKEFIMILKINIFPLFAWTSGLFTLYLLYSYLIKYLKLKKEILIFLLFIFIYFSLLILGETIGYHYLDIKNDQTAQYPGIIICDCIHAPKWMQISYFMLGIIFFLSCKLFDYIKKKRFKNYLFFS